MFVSYFSIVQLFIHSTILHISIQIKYINAVTYKYGTYVYRRVSFYNQMHSYMRFEKHENNKNYKIQYILGKWQFFLYSSATLPQLMLLNDADAVNATAYKAIPIATVRGVDKAVLFSSSSSNRLLSSQYSIKMHNAFIVKNENVILIKNI